MEQWLHDDYSSENGVPIALSLLNGVEPRDLNHEHLTEFVIDKCTTITSEVTLLQDELKHIDPQLLDGIPTSKLDDLLSRMKELQKQSKRLAVTMKFARQTYQFIMGAVDRALRKGEDLTVQIPGYGCGGDQHYPSKYYWVTHNQGRMMGIQAAFDELRRQHWKPRMGGLNRGTLCEDNHGGRHVGGNGGAWSYLLIHCDLTSTIIVEDKKAR